MSGVDVIAKKKSANKLSSNWSEWPHMWRGVRRKKKSCAHILIQKNSNIRSWLFSQSWMLLKSSDWLWCSFGSVKRHKTSFILKATIWTSRTIFCVPGPCTPWGRRFSATHQKGTGAAAEMQCQQGGRAVRGTRAVCSWAASTAQTSWWAAASWRLWGSACCCHPAPSHLEDGGEN